MPLEWTYSSEDVDWEELYRLYLAASLGDQSAGDLKLGFAKSTFKCFVYDAGRLIAVGRALTVGRESSYICGVAVHPDHQGLGLGTEIVTRLMSLSRGYKKISLHAAPGREPFYRKLGFKRTGTTMTLFQEHAAEGQR
jgi:ribosomal protein S18 acetylase RimI-like enzyme